ncbi:hypothetical protein [Paenibacillus taichungensis]|uniref:hypothetical protein n=1 Tax=Paenibacillus taichungensis TaxID=484184 RepID=UPI0039A0F021
MNNELLFYVDTNWLGEGNLEFTVVKMNLESGNAKIRSKIKGRSHSECGEKLHQIILEEKPSQVIFENTGIAVASKDSYMEHLWNHSRGVLMGESGRLHYSPVANKQQNTRGEKEYE